MTSLSKAPEPRSIAVTSLHVLSCTRLCLSPAIPKTANIRYFTWLSHGLSKVQPRQTPRKRLWASTSRAGRATCVTPIQASEPPTQADHPVQPPVASCRSAGSAPPQMER
ncbi:hypothetical protein N658DRAFT_211000 [Parathielavia hyrcaniae]|uniref:Uncharacterized protein n=1 Tax=Parathielavia hyrcaniae TaxID=113614 RepID=A0AAN6PXA7_9PEZI|nr:hypothetical protein N658DRAFT_211000 [Parathielavia hyrcaniae]